MKKANSFGWCIAGLVVLCAVVVLPGCGGGGDDNSNDQISDVVTNQVGGDPVVVTNTPAAETVYSSGNATIQGTYRFDLDEGISGGTQDVWWNRVTLTDSMLVPQNGARITSLGAINFNGVTKGSVQAMSLGAAGIPNTALPVGTVLAYKTSDGRYGKMKVKNYSGNQDMAMSWVTWE